MGGSISIIFHLSPLALWIVLSSFVLSFILLSWFCRYLLERPLFDRRLEKVTLEAKGTDASSKFFEKLTMQVVELKSEKEKKKESLQEKIAKRFRQKKYAKPDRLKAVFEQAGWITYDAKTVYVMGKTMLTMVIGLMGYIIFSVGSAAENYTPTTRFYGIIGIFIFGWYSFDLILKAMTENRLQKIEKGLPDALDLLVVCVQAGLTLNKGLERVAKEMVIFNVEVAREFATTSVELELLLDRRHALHNFAARVPSAAVKNFTTNLTQSIQQGTPILQTLELLSEETRLKKMQQAELKAAKLPSLMILPLAVFILPNMFIVLLGPSIANMMKML